MSSNRKLICDGAFKITEIGKDISLDEWAYRILTEIGGIGNTPASEYVSKFHKSICNHLLLQNDELKRKGITITGEINSGRVYWTNSNPIQHAIWQLRPIYLGLIEKLSDDQFEGLCCLAMSLIGGKAWKTKSKGDGNVDFYATANSTMNNHIFGKANKFRIVGQCKNYSHQESVTNFESFFRAVDNVKFHATRVVSEIPNEFIRENGPIIGWYICKEGFQNGVFDEARKHGVVLSDKYDLAEILVKLSLNGISKSISTLCHLNLMKNIAVYLK
ncbi:MAG: hypothetical protein EOO42_09940 [Flavobacteriales bacterium]|nr:MAG: hypothetical protein EOO42_09940 [Flavobacteriales bacterium]